MSERRERERREVGKRRELGEPNLAILLRVVRLSGVHSIPR